MWKTILNFLQSAASSYQRLTQAEGAIKTLQETSDDHDNEFQDSKQTLFKVLHEFDKVIRQIESDKQVAIEQRRAIEAERRAAERDYENLALRLELTMKNETRALPPGSPGPPQDEIAALQAKIEALEKRIEILENAN